VVELHRLHVSRHVEHVVGAIVSPFGKSIRERPPIPTPEERLAEYKQKRFLKLERRELRARAAEGDAEAIKRLTEMGLDPGNGAQAGVGRKVNAQHGVGKQRDPSSGAILGSKGQKLPKGVLPGGEHEVGKINDRSRHNKEKAMKFEQKSEQRLLEAKEKGEELAQQGLASRR
jgi:small subunit ribosomal protein S17